ncbi:hypothetical protein B0H15DRAFT_926007 [Mycena belliarum]|uniref:Uncharacterized protein n=1 Tax=Mycena belliarum TaxID=1033014 RepID=A0AAD6TN93_9AGAR|nr:hypothetical protein B0H15DRAFT_926007 [Mycena belliae]
MCRSLVDWADDGADVPHQPRDYPLKYPITLYPAAMTLHESLHFSLNVSDALEADEWFLYSSIPKGIGRTRLGPQQRVFELTVSHQMHCLRRIYLALVDHDDLRASSEHVNHCLNYLRQTLLCDAADALEFGDFMARDYDVERIGDTLVCDDWERAIDFFDEKYAEWLEWTSVYKRLGGISGSVDT